MGNRLSFLVVRLLIAPFRLLPSGGGSLKYFAANPAELARIRLKLPDAHLQFFNLRALLLDCQRRRTLHTPESLENRGKLGTEHRQLVFKLFQELSGIRDRQVR